MLPNFYYQSIVDGNFLYNGVRLCDYFMKHLRKTSSGQSFKQLLFKRFLFVIQLSTNLKTRIKN